MVFHRSLKSPQVFRTLLSILVVLNNVVVWMVSASSLISKSSSPFKNPLVTVLKAPITIGIIVTFMFHNFFSSLAPEVLILLFTFVTWSPTERREIRSFPYPSVFELTGLKDWPLKRGKRNVGQLLGLPCEWSKECRSSHLYSVTSPGWKR